MAPVSLVVVVEGEEAHPEEHPKRSGWGEARNGPELGGGSRPGKAALIY